MHKRTEALSFLAAIFFMSASDLYSLSCPAVHYTIASTENINLNVNAADTPRLLKNALN